MSDISSPSALSVCSDFDTVVRMSPLLDANVSPSTNDISFGKQLPDGSAQVANHTLFCFEDGSLQFIVENAKYSIHRSLVRKHSPVWLEELYHQPESTLRNVTIAEMDALLSILYPSDVCHRDISSVEEWTAVLRLSTRWSIATFQKLALQKLETLASALDKLVIARQLNISSWVEPAICTLCLRPDPLTLAEAQRLEMTDVVAIFTVQQRVQTNKIPATAEAAVSQFRALLDLDGESLRDHVSPDIRTTTTLVGEVDILPSCGRSSQAVRDENLAVTFDHEALFGLLQRRKFEEAVGSMSDSEDHHESIVQVLVDWTNTPAPTEDIGEVVRQPVNSFDPMCGILSVVEELVRRSARDRAFIPAAVRVLSELPRLASDAAGSILKTLQSAVECILSRPAHKSDAKDDCPDAECPGWSGKYIRATWETLCGMSEEEFSRRCRCAVEFVRMILEHNLISASFVIDKLPVAPANAPMLYKILSVLGPAFDSSIERSKVLDNFLDQLQIPCSVRISSTGSRIIRIQSVHATGALQLPLARTWVKLLILRERKWVAAA